MLIWTPLVLLIGPFFWFYDCIRNAAGPGPCGILLTIIYYLLFLPFGLAMGAVFAALMEIFIVLIAFCTLLNVFCRVFCCLLKCGKIAPDRCI